MQQTLIERILAKTVGLQLSADEIALVAGGQIPLCLNNPDAPYDTYFAHTVVCDAS